MPESAPELVFTCEHASNRAPAGEKKRFATAAARKALNSHRGHDPGAAELTRRLAREFSAPACFGKYTRLLIELNRSRHHPGLWSEFSRELDTDQKIRWINDHYEAYRNRVRRHLRDAIARAGRVLHLSVHSFTPVLDGETRNADIGLLYDPGRENEKLFCLRWRRALEETDRGLRVRRNYPYRGVADGFVTALRKEFPEEEYVGIELEVNQAVVHAGPRAWRRFQTLLVGAFGEALPALPG